MWRGVVTFGAALVEIADQQIGAAGVTQLPYLPQQVSDGDGGIGHAAGTQVLAVGVDEGGPVGGGDAQGRGFGHPGVAFDSVQGQAQSAGAVEQADPLAEEAVDLVPAFPGGLLAHSAGAGRVDGDPAVGVRADLGLHLVAQVAPQMPPVADLHCVGQNSADGLGVGGGAVPAYDLDAGMVTQPGLQGRGLAVRQDRDASAGLGIDDNRGVAVAAAQGEVVDADHSRNHLPCRGTGRRRSRRRAVLRDTGAASTRARRAAARPHNSRATSDIWPVSRTVRR